MAVPDNSPPRTAHRSKIFQPAMMVSADTNTRIHLLDVSTTGALVHAVVPPAAGDRVEIIAGEAPVTFSLGRAQVAWVSGTRFGVSFATPLSAKLIASVIDARGASAATGKPTR